MNTAFGNPKGDPKDIDFSRVRKQSLNIIDELGELFIALGSSPESMEQAVATFKIATRHAVPDDQIDLDEVRDALCDIKVFSYGAQHLMGIDGDADMHAVVAGVMTRFIKDAGDKGRTISLHAAKGVTEVYFEGGYPTMVMKSSVDQPDAPKGKFLKSYSYQNTDFPPV